MYDRLLLLTAVLVPLLPSVVVDMAMCFWLYSRHSLRRRKSSGVKLMLDADGSQQGAGSNSAPSTTTTRRRRGRLWPLECKGKASLTDVTADDIKALSKEECVCLFRLLRPATMQQLHGEWHGEILAMGLFYPLAYLLWHWRLGRGWWLGKGIDAESRQGYNTFYNHGAKSMWGPVPMDGKRRRKERRKRRRSGGSGRAQGKQDRPRCGCWCWE